MNKKLAAVLVFIIIGNIYSCGNKKAVAAIQTNDEENTEQVEPLELTVQAEPTRAQRVMNALLAAYPDRIEKIEFRNDDWALLLRDTWYYYAEGRLLPEDKRENISSYRPVSFYPYPEELPSWTPRTPEETERFRSWSERRQNTTWRSSYFLDSLWQSSSRAETESRLARITFLGRRIRVHYFIQDKLAAVETRIRAAAQNDSEVQTWLNSIGTIEGWHWRNIAQTQNRSYHSYGLAVDILPRTLGRRQTYWLWTSQHREDWWNVSYNERYHPPAAVIKAFEANGFIWGGKWALFDTMHFEYRPEILFFNGLMPQISEQFPAD